MAIKDLRIFIIVDMQNDFVSGALAVPGASEIIPEIIRAADEFKAYRGVARNRIVFTRDTHTLDYMDTMEAKLVPVKHCIADTPGWCITDELFGLSYFSDVINKDRFGYDKWDYYFEDNNIKEVYICGVATDICVLSNAVILRSLLPKIPIKVLADCCRGTSPEKHEMALRIMEGCGIDVIKEEKEEK